MLTSLDYLRIFTGLLYIFWTIVMIYHIHIYTLGDKKHIHKLLSIFVENVEKWETHNNTAALGVGGGGMFLGFCIAYPFIRHKRKYKTWTFDIFMFINCFWLVSLIFFYFYLPDVRT